MDFINTECLHFQKTPSLKLHELVPISRNKCWINDYNSTNVPGTNYFLHVLDKIQVELR